MSELNTKPHRHVIRLNFRNRERKIVLSRYMLRSTGAVPHTTSSGHKFSLQRITLLRRICPTRWRLRLS